MNDAAMDANHGSKNLSDRFMQICGLVAAVMGVACMACWWVGWSAFFNIKPYIRMAPNSTWMFVLLGVALFGSSSRSTGTIMRRIAAVFVVLSMLVAVADLIDLFFGHLLCKNIWLLRCSVFFGSRNGTHMSPLTSGSFVLVGLAILLLMRQVAGVAAFLGTLVVVAAWTNLMGYWFGVLLLHEQNGIPMAFSTSVVLLVLGAGLIVGAGPDTWPLSILTPLPFQKEPFPRRRSIKGPAGVFLLLCVMIGAAGYPYIKSEYVESRRLAWAEVNAVADLKVRQIERWYGERMADARFFKESHWLGQAIKSYLQNPTDEGQKTRIVKRLSAARQNFKYSRLVLLDSRQQVILAVPEEKGWVGEKAQTLAAQAMRTREIQVSDLHNSKKKTGSMDMDVFVPLIPASALNDPTIAPTCVLEIELDPNEFLFPAIASWPTPSKTAEALLIRRDGNFVEYLNVMRTQPDKENRLRLRIDRWPNLPAVMAVSGKEGIVEGVDYNGDEVLAALRRVSGTPWFLVAKIDQAEVYAPLRQRIIDAAIILFVLVLAAALGVGLLQRRRDQQWLERQLTAERELRESEERFKAVTANTPDHIVVQDRDLRYTWVINPQLGLTEEDMIGKTDHDLLPPEDAGRLDSIKREVIETGKSVHVEIPLINKNGVIEYFDGSYIPKHDANGNVDGLIGYFKNITEHKRAETNQRLAAETLRLLNRGGDLHTLVGKMLRLIRETMSFDAVGLRIREGEDFPYYEQSGFSDDFVHKENHICVKDANNALVRSADGRAKLECTCGLVLSGQTDPQQPFFTKGGSFWTNDARAFLALEPKDDPRTSSRNRCIHAGYQSVALIPLRLGDEIIGLLQLNDLHEGRFSPELVRFFEGLAANIAVAFKRRQVEDALRESETTLSSIVRAAPSGIGVTVNRTLVEVNDLICSMTGYSREELVGQSARKLYPTEEDFEFVGREKYGMIREKGTGTVETRWRRKDGTIIDILLSSTPLNPEDYSQGVTFTALDITESKRAQAERETTVEFLRLINTCKEKEDLVRQALIFFQKQSGCEAVGLRLKEGEDYPYYEFRGFSREFILAENSLCRCDAAGEIIRDSMGNPQLECMCGNVICGRIDAAKPFFTGHGSFWANDTTRLLATTTDEDRQTFTRNRCNGEGYESVALIPLHIGEDRFGLLQLNDRQKGMFARETIALWERLADHLAVALSRIRAEEALRDSEEQFRVLVENSVMGVSLIQEGGFVYVNPRLAEMLGYTREEMLGRNPVELVAEADRPMVQESIRKRLSGEVDAAQYVFRARHKDESIVYLELHGGVIMYHGRRAMLSTLVDITERMQIEEERLQLMEAERAARAEAERANRLKDDFLATASHELRNPLNGILGWAQLLSKGRAKNEDLQRGLDIIQRNARAQAQLVEDLLDVSRMVSGKLRLDIQTVELPVIIEAALAAVEVSAREKGIKLHHRIGPRVGEMQGDPARLQQVLWNLLSNAIKFTPKGGRVDVVAERVNGSVEIRVKDTGEGITPEFLPHLFGRFRQADSSITRKHGGLGIGLSIVKHIVEMHDGTVRAESAGVNQGATFIVELPVAGVTERRGASVLSIHGGRQLSLECNPTILQGVRVLVVDDDAETCELVRRYLQDYGAQAATAISAREGLVLLDTFKPDVLLSDIGMPEQDGYEFIREIRTRPPEQGGQVPAVAMTAFARPEDRTQAMTSGFQLHLAKPVEPSELIAVVASLTGRDGEVHAGGSQRNESQSDHQQPEPEVPMHDEPKQSKAGDRLTGNGAGSATLLLAEDNAVIAEMLKTSLESRGYKVHRVAGVKQGAEVAARESIDLLLSDLRLIDGMGWDLMAKLRENRPIPGIMMSGYSDEVYRIKAKAAGFEKYLVKPVEEDILCDCVANLLGREVPTV